MSQHDSPYAPSQAPEHSPYAPAHTEPSPYVPVHPASPYAPSKH